MLSCDPEREFDIRDAEEARWLRSRPVCDICGEPIQEDHYYDLNSEIVCDDCLDSYLKKCEVMIDNA